jgi:predicted negative regulator of RcsB-dependent stress response
VAENRQTALEMKARAADYKPYENPDLTPKTSAQEDVEVIGKALKAWDASMGAKNEMENILKSLENRFRLGEMNKVRTFFDRNEFAFAREELNNVLEYRKKGYILWDSDSGQWRAP